MTDIIVSLIVTLQIKWNDSSEIWTQDLTQTEQTLQSTEL